MLGPRSIVGSPTTAALAVAVAGFVAAAPGCGGATAFLPPRAALELSADGSTLGPLPLDGRASLAVTVANVGDAASWVTVTLGPSPASDGETAAPDATVPDGLSARPLSIYLAPGEDGVVELIYAPSGARADASIVATFDGDQVLVPASLTVPVEAPADFDDDGHDHVLAGGDDCDDTDAAVHPGAEERWYDGVDDDCDGNDTDADGDGFDASEAGGDDCDDADPAVFPGAADTWYDGVDSDCNGNEADRDGDGFDAAAVGGPDCDDDNPAIHPGADDAYDLVDNDCDGIFDEDAMPEGLLWFSELMLAPDASAARWIELSGRGDHRTWRLSGWRLDWQAGTSSASAALPEISLTGDAVVVLCDDAVAAAAAGVACAVEVVDWPALTGEVGELSLALPTALDAADVSVTFDRLTWDASWSAATPGVALQLDGALTASAEMDPGANDAQAAWCLATAAWPDGGGDLGSPNDENADCGGS